MSDHSLKNVHTARVYEIEPGDTGTFGDTEWLALINGPLVLGGLLVDPNATTSGDDDMSTILVETGTCTLTVAATTKLFQVTGGAIEIVDLVGEITTAFGATASNGSYSSIIDEGPTTTALCTTTSVASAAKGKRLVWPGAVGSALLVSSVGGALINGYEKYLMAPGEIDFITSGNTTGTAIFRLRYRKHDPNAVVTAAF